MFVNLQIASSFQQCLSITNMFGAVRDYSGGWRESKAAKATHLRIPSDGFICHMDSQTQWVDPGRRCLNLITANNTC